MHYIFISIVIVVLFFTIEQQKLAEMNKNISEAKAKFIMALENNDKIRDLSVPTVI
jgi:hypothetical protein